MDSQAKVLRKKRVKQLLQDAAVSAVGQGDPWAKYNLQKIPAERVIRHLYHPETASWSTDDTIVKIGKEPFTHGAMRYCFRMKKRAQPPAEASNHRFHKLGWAYASNYVASKFLVCFFLVMCTHPLALSCTSLCTAQKLTFEMARLIRQTRPNSAS